MKVSSCFNILCVAAYASSSSLIVVTMMLSGSLSSSTFVDAQKRRVPLSSAHGDSMDQTLLTMVEIEPFSNNVVRKSDHAQRSLQAKGGSKGGKCGIDDIDRRRHRYRRLDRASVELADKRSMSHQRAALRKGGPSGSEVLDNGSKWQQQPHRQAQADVTKRDGNTPVRRHNRKNGRRLSHSKDGGDDDDDCDPPCFPAEAIVEVWDGESFVLTQIKDAAIGDELKCIVVGTQEIGRCPLYFHWHPSGLIPDPSVYRKVIHEEGEIVLSFDHMLYSPPSPGTASGDTFPNGLPAFSAVSDNFVVPQDLQKGDLIVVNVDGTLTAVEVEDVKDHSADTFFAPLVQGGMIIVDDVVASSYVKFDGTLDPYDGADTAHYIFAAMNTGQFLPLMTTGVLDYYQNFTGLTRDDPEYLAWEVDNYAGYAREYFWQTYYAMYESEFVNSETLTGEEAIEFYNSVMQVSNYGTTPVGDTTMAWLYSEAVVGNTFNGLPP